MDLIPLLLDRLLLFLFVCFVLFYFSLFAYNRRCLRVTSKFGVCFADV